MWNSLICPLVVIRPIRFALNSVNHTKPPGPDVMSRGKLSGDGTGYSVTTPCLLIRPIALVPGSVNHSAPSGPSVMAWGLLPGVGSGYSMVEPARAGGATSVSAVNDASTTQALVIGSPHRRWM